MLLQSSANGFQLGELGVNVLGRKLTLSQNLDQSEGAYQVTIHRIESILMPGQLQVISLLGNVSPILNGCLDGKLGQCSPLLLAAGNPLGDNNRTAANEGTKKSVNGWVELWHGLAGSIGFAVGYIGVTLIYMWWPLLWPNEKS